MFAVTAIREGPLCSGRVETWGRGERFGHVPMPDGRVYCYLMANAPIGSRTGLDQLRERFTRWHDPIPTLLNSARADAVLQHDTDELPELRTYVSGKVALLGDAAHAMTPNLGQGACQALEDAVTLASTVDTLGVGAGPGGIRPHPQTTHPADRPPLPAGRCARALDLPAPDGPTRRDAPPPASLAVRTLDHPRLHLDDLTTSERFARWPCHAS